MKLINKILNRIQRNKVLSPEYDNYNYTEIIGLAVGILIIFFMLASIIVPDKDFSDRENRVLTSFPHLSKASVLDGSYMKEMGNYCADQFVMRNFWIKMRTKYRHLLGKFDSNGVYLGANEYLFELIEEPNQEQFEKNMYAINALAIETGLPVKVMIVPNSACILKDYLPKNAPIADQNKYLDSVRDNLVEGIDFIDVRNAFKKAQSKVQLYYRTDHHWTTDAAFIAFTEACETLGIDPSGIKYKYYAVTNKFSGTLAAKSGFSVKKDTIKAFAWDSDVKYVVEYTEEAKKSASVYDTKKLNSNDKYGVFFGGNHAQVKIRTTSESNKRLLIVKDSFANSFVPFLIPFYSEIIMVDPRYYSGDMRKMAKSEGINDVLFLYNGNTFFEDTSMVDVVAEQESVPAQ